MNSDPELKEMLDVYDASGRKTGAYFRGHVHANAMIHHTVRVWLVHEGKAWFQRRAETKAVFPGRLDPCATGHIGTGETPIDAAVRELAEETGIGILPDNLVFAGTLPMPFRRPDGALDDEIAHIYIYHPDAMPVLDPTDEAAGFACQSIGGYERMLAEADPDALAKFCQPDPAEFTLVKRALERIWAGWL